MFNAAINDDPTVYAIPIFIACILVEAFIDFRSRTNLYHKKDSAASISMGLGVVVIGLVTKTFYFFVFSLILLISKNTNSLLQAQKLNLIFYHLIVNKKYVINCYLYTYFLVKFVEC